MLSSQDTDRLRPDVATDCRAWSELCHAAGLLVLVIGTVRGEEYQQYCFENGTTATPVPSFHGEQAGLASGFYQSIKGQEYSDSVFFQWAGELGEQAGFEWGSRWKSFLDWLRLQWNGDGKYTGSMIRAGGYPPAMLPYRGEGIDMMKEEVQVVIDAIMTTAWPPVYTSMENCPTWAREAVQKTVDEGVLWGDQGGKLCPTDDSLVNPQMFRNLDLLDGGGV